MIKLILLAAAAAGAIAAAKVTSDEKKSKALSAEPKRSEAALNDPTAKEYDMDYMYV